MVSAGRPSAQAHDEGGDGRDGPYDDHDGGGDRDRDRDDHDGDRDDHDDHGADRGRIPLCPHASRDDCQIFCRSQN